jgi:hypothetical protein
MAIRTYILVLFAILIHDICYSQSNQIQVANLFESEEILNLQLSGNLHDLLNDTGDRASYQAFTLSYKSTDNNFISIPIKIKQRGHFRRTVANCTYPPLLLNFSKEDTPTQSMFYKQNKLKLVTPCQGEKYVVREYLVYKLYNLISDKSFKSRLVKVTYEDTERKKISDPLYGILLEDEQHLASRNETTLIEGRVFKPDQTQPDDFLKMAVFQYLIGNTDWSVQFYQNIKLIGANADIPPSAVPYDFDHAGIVGAPYALPAPELMLSSTKERRYRGYCLSDLTKLNSTFHIFNSLKDQIYAVYINNSMLEPGYIKATVKFLDDFYKSINDPKLVTREFGYPCRQDGTGNVIIQGLKKN